MIYAPSAALLAHLEEQGIDQQEFELDDALFAETEARFLAEHRNHETAEQVHDRTAYFLIWQRYGVPNPEKSSSGQASPDVTNGQRIVEINEIAKKVRKEQLPEVISGLQDVRFAVDAAKKALSETEDNNEARCDHIISAIDENVGELCGKVMYASDRNQEWRFDFQGKLWKFLYTIIFLLIALILSNIFSPRAHAQVPSKINVIKYKENGNLKKTAAAPHTVDYQGCGVSASGSTVTVGCTGGGNLIQTGLMAEYRFNEGSGTQLTDYSANAYHGTLAGAPNTPTWTTGGLSFSSSTNNYIDLPAALNTAQTIIVFYNTAASELTYQALWGPSTSGGPSLFFYQTSGGLTYTRPTIIYGGTFSTRTSDSATGTHMLSVAFDASADKMYIDDAEVGTYTAQQGNSTRMSSGHYQLGTGTTGLGTTLARFSGTMYYALFYSTKLTAAEIAQNYRALSNRLQAEKGIRLKPAPPSTASDNRFIAIGDSITKGGVGGSTPYTSLMSTTDTFTFKNHGVNGKTAYDIPDHAYWAVLVERSAGTKQICGIWAGINDVTTNTAPVIVGRLKEAANTCHAYGMKVIVGTLLSSVGRETERNAVNALIYAQWPYFADGIADMGRNALLGTDGAAANVTYFSDGLHPTSAGNQLIADIWSDAIDNLSWFPSYGYLTYANLPPNPNNGEMVVCSDCTVANPTASGGTGALLLRIGGAWVGTANTASALTANGTNCAAGSYARGVDASGNAENCTVAAGAGTVTNTGTLTSGALIKGNGGVDVSASGATISGSTITATLSGLASTATALAADPADCGANTFAQSINASGTLTCAAVGLGTSDTTGTLTVAKGGTGSAPGADDQLLVSDTTTSATWRTLTTCTGAGKAITYDTATNTFGCNTIAGTVSSVAQSFTGGLISVAGSPVTTSGTLALTVAGTSGGIPYFSSGTTWASSSALTANLPVIGGGAGVAPSVGTRSGNTTAFVTTTGAQTSGDCVKIDANGNHVANGSACGGAGVGYVILVTADNASFNPADATPYCEGINANNRQTTCTGVTYDRVKFQMPAACTATRVYYKSITQGTLSSAEDATFAIRLNDSSDFGATTTQIDMSAAIQDAAVTVSQAIAAGDYVALKVTTPTWATNPTSVLWSAYIYCS